MDCAIVVSLVTQPSWRRSCASIVWHAPPAPTQVNSLHRIRFRWRRRLTASDADDIFINESQCSTTWHQPSKRWQLNVLDRATIITTTRIGRNRRRGLLLQSAPRDPARPCALRVHRPGQRYKGETDGGCGESYFESVHVVNDAGEQLLDHRRPPAHFWRLWFGWSFFSWRWLFAGHTTIESACCLET